MKKPRRFLSVKGIFIFLIGWLIMAQSCLKLRTSDSKAKEIFKKSKVRFSISNITVNNRTIHYTMSGQDTLPTLVFIHGSPGSWDAFIKYMQDSALLAKYRMVSIDRPGFGYSNFGEALNLADESIAISPLFPHIYNHKPVYLIGHSLGGPMVVQLAADNPGMFKALVILSGAIDVKLEEPERWRPILMNNPLKFLVPGALRPSNDELWYLKKDLIALQSKFPLITCPVVIMHGDKDPLVDYRNLAFGKKVLINSPRVDTITLVGANHFIPWMHYAEIKKVLLSLP